MRSSWLIEQQFVSERATGEIENQLVSLSLIANLIEFVFKLCTLISPLDFIVA